MSHTYTGTDTWAASTTLPDDGDSKKAASVNVPFEALMDRTTYLYNRKPYRYLVKDEHWGLSGASIAGSNTHTTYDGNGDIVLGPVSVVVPNDVIEIIAQIHVVGNGTDTCNWRLAYKVGFGSKIGIDFSEAIFAGTPNTVITLVGYATITTSGALSTIIQSHVGSAGAAETHSPYSVIVNILRLS